MLLDNVKKFLRASMFLKSKNKIFETVENEPEYIRSDNGGEFTAKAVRQWLSHLAVETLYIELGSPWENAYIEGYNGKLRDEVFNGKIFCTLKKAQVMIKRWRQQ